jgi:hypothetical protein
VFRRVGTHVPTYRRVSNGVTLFGIFLCPAPTAPSTSPTSYRPPSTSPSSRSDPPFVSTSTPPHLSTHPTCEAISEAHMEQATQSPWDMAQPPSASIPGDLTVELPVAPHHRSQQAPCLLRLRAHGAAQVAGRRCSNRTWGLTCMS